MTQKMKDVVEGFISNGPNRWSLILEAFVNKGDVEFEVFNSRNETVKLKMVLVVEKIENIEGRDMVSDHWCIWGYLDHKNGEDQFRKKLCELMDLDFLTVQSEPCLYFVATYSTLHRDGRIKFSFDYAKTQK